MLRPIPPVRHIGRQTFRVSTEAQIRARFMFGVAAHGYSIISLTPTHTHSYVIWSLPATFQIVPQSKPAQTNAPSSPELRKQISHAQSKSLPRTRRIRN